MMIPDKTKIQSIDLIIKDLKRSLDFYVDQLGFKSIKSESNKEYLSANGNSPYIISLEEKPDAMPTNRHSAGLYHTAFRFPDRKSLAKEFLHLYNIIKFHGFSDHIVSEAIYFADPDGNGIEFYVDKPKSQWQWDNGQVVMDTLPLDIDDLIKSTDEDDPQWNSIDPKTEIGHVHLSVTELTNAEKFYSKLIGFNITNSSYCGALFMSAGGYHHHIGTNIWSSENGSPHNENEIGLKSFTINIPDPDYVEKIKSSLKKIGIEHSEIKNGIEIRDFDNIKVKIIS